MRSEVKLQFNAVYGYQWDGIARWLRFFEDGTVFSLTAMTDEPKRIYGWMDPSHQQSGKGTWNVNAEELAITLHGTAGDLEMNGYMNEDGNLVLTQYSEADESRSEGCEFLLNEI